MRLKYVEFHAVDHCNLNCNGCTHFSNISEEKFVSVSGIKKDLIRLKELFDTVGEIRILGGEPFLHPKLNIIFEITRTIFKKSNIRVVSNLLSFHRNSIETYELMKKLDIGLDASVYPIVRSLKKDAKLICEMFGISFRCKIRNTMWHQLSDRKSNKSNAMKNCRKHWKCPYLESGKIHICGPAALIWKLNDKYSTEYSVSQGIDIHNKNVDAKTILNYLETPNSSCSNCTENYTKFKWNRVNPNLYDWIG